MRYALGCDFFTIRKEKFMRRSKDQAEPEDASSSVELRRILYRHVSVCCRVSFSCYTTLDTTENFPRSQDVAVVAVGAGDVVGYLIGGQSHQYHTRVHARPPCGVK